MFVALLYFVWKYENWKFMIVINTHLFWLCLCMKYKIGLGYLLGLGLGYLLMGIYYDYVFKWTY